MANWISEGNSLDIDFPAGAVTGVPIQVGPYVGLPSGNKTAGQRGALQVTGLVRVEKLTTGGSAHAFGDVVDFDPDQAPAPGVVVPAGTGGVNSFPFGVVSESNNTDADAFVEVRLGPDSAGRALLPTVALTLGAESGNFIPVNITADLGVLTRCICKVYDNDGLHAIVAEFTVTEVGPGAELSATAQPTLILETDAAGQADIRVLDVSGAFVGSVWLEVTPENGGPQIVELVYA